MHKYIHTISTHKHYSTLPCPHRGISELKWKTCLKENKNNKKKLNFGEDKHVILWGSLRVKGEPWNDTAGV